MSIIKVKSSKKETPTSGSRLAGAFVPSQVSSYLSLYALAHGITKSMIVRELIEDWYRDQRGDRPEDVLIEKVVAIAWIEWKSEESRFPDSDFLEYKIELSTQLQKKKIFPYNIELILKKLQDEANKEADQ